MYIYKILLISYEIQIVLTYFTCNNVSDTLTRFKLYILQ